MSLKLYAYQINGQTIGLDIHSWTNEDLNGNISFITLNDNNNVPANYADITSIQNWYNYAPDSNIAKMQIIDIANATGYNNLSTADKVIVDEIGFYYNIYKYVYDSSKYDLQVVPFDLPYSIDEAPYNLDYDVVGLHKRQYFVKGELLKVEYYGQYDVNTNTYTDLCIQEDRTYNRSNGFLSNRDMLIQWFKSDGTVGATKNTKKYYNTFDAIIAGNTRRENIIDEVKIVAVGLMAMVEQISMDQAQVVGKDFLSAISSNITLYVKGNEQELIDQITNDTTFPFLNDVIPNAGGFTIRMYMLDALTIDYNKVYTMADQSPFSFFNTI